MRVKLVFILCLTLQYVLEKFSFNTTKVDKEGKAEKV